MSTYTQLKVSKLIQLASVQVVCFIQCSSESVIASLRNVEENITFFSMSLSLIATVYQTKKSLQTRGFALCSDLSALIHFT